MQLITETQKRLFHTIFDDLLLNYGKVQYLRVSGSNNYSYVPKSLWKLWYSDSTLSISNIEEKYHSIKFSEEMDAFLIEMCLFEKRLAGEFHKL
ncbi:MAG: hypothetical protein KC455_02700 [Carnobacterium sp.]|nr:hypothetical protein [Carnobacterium sp.]